MANPETPAAIPKIISLLSFLLQKVAGLNDLNRRVLPRDVSVFHSTTLPSISIRKYLERIFKNADCSPCCFVVAFVYIDRISRMHPSFPINSLNIHRLLITSVMVAAKFADDICHNNAHYASIGGVSRAEMNFLELKFVFGLGFHLHVSRSTYNTYCSYLRYQMLLESPLDYVESPPNIKERSSGKLEELGFKEDGDW
ncbi:cyclin-U4-1-like [Malania oleifera]|uniref:cyclin-U4-1-like n=1 Tax=Malania oleifera TaxID=397392 RepID=UPI0025AE6C43|nr:cyclin-U4-1-like [Malania oleifera]